MKKVFLTISFIALFLTIFTLFFICNCNSWGDNDLGNNFSLLGGDRIEETVIVYCTNRDEINNCCAGGIYIIPSDQYHTTDGEYSEFIKTVEYNDKWIIAKTFKIETRKNRYWILNADLSNRLSMKNYQNIEKLLQEYVTGPLDSLTFNSTINELKIDLKIN